MQPFQGFTKVPIEKDHRLIMYMFMCLYTDVELKGIELVVYVSCANYFHHLEKPMTS